MPIPLEKIIEAAEKAGFATELLAASILDNANWRPSQNVYFIDKDEGKARELDIRAYKIFASTKEKPEVTCMISLCIEVKKTADPFIFYTNRKSDYDGSSGYGIFHWKNNVDRFVLSYGAIEAMRPMAAVERVARSYSCFKSGQTQQIQSGVISAFKAAIHERDNCEEVYSDLSGDICFFVPMMVVDGPLYECFFEQGGDTLVASEIDEVLYVQNYHSGNYGRVSNHVYVMNLSTFSKRLPEFSAWGEHMLAVMAQNRAKVATADEVD
ncbi:hypothetical protein D4A92_01915 [Rhizobium rosettiformans]|uniref:Uncharacterized protein n=1 Tax=Rhizobium rosettiformans TaxID=1368430 RepID=A0ABX7ET13_9HYPH|nr:hypothetical protein [Rhizobium rosettiformans]QRF50286.1 hypothetical protein D4A92_01915 [Rhizobium rosettiformans]